MIEQLRQWVETRANARTAPINLLHSAAGVPNLIHTRRVRMDQRTRDPVTSIGANDVMYTVVELLLGADLNALTISKIRADVASPRAEHLLHQ